MAKELEGKKVAILATDGVERVELDNLVVRFTVQARPVICCRFNPGEIEARQFDMVAAGTLAVDRQVSDASVDDYDALLLPGGTVNPDTLRLDSDASPS